MSQETAKTQLVSREQMQLLTDLSDRGYAARYKGLAIKPKKGTGPQGGYFADQKNGMDLDNFAQLVERKTGFLVQTVRTGMQAPQTEYSNQQVAAMSVAEVANILAQKGYAVFYRQFDIVRYSAGDVEVLWTAPPLLFGYNSMRIAVLFAQAEAMLQFQLPPAAAAAA